MFLPVALKSRWKVRLERESSVEDLLRAKVNCKPDARDLRFVLSLVVA